MSFRSYPPKHWLNGNRHFPYEGSLRDTRLDWWPGDTAENADGSIDQLDRDGTTWHTVVVAKTFNQAAE